MEKFKLFRKQKPALLLTLGSAAGFIVGGGIAWWLIQRKPTLAGMPVGTEVLPQDVAATFSFATDKGQWQQLRRFGTPETQAAFDQNLAKLRDSLLTANGFNYQRDIQPWVGEEITVAILPPPAETDAEAQQVQPYDPSRALDESSTVFVLPIADPEKAQALLTRPKVTTGQEWVDREYKGVKIREIHGQTERAYVAAALDNRFLVVSENSQAVERVIDTHKGKPSVAQAPGYSQALSHVETIEPFLQMYVNLPVSSTLAANNANQPVPPQGLALLQNNQGITAAMTLEPEGVRLQGATWLAPNSKTRLKVSNNAERMASLLPAETLMMTSGGNLKQSWQNANQEPQESVKPSLLNPATIEQGFANLTGLDLEKDMVNWMNGEFAVAVVSSPKSETATGTAGLLLLLQTTDRRAADEAFQKLDDVMTDRYRFQVSEAQIEGQPVVNWVSPFTALTVSRGWMDGNVAFLAIGGGVAETLLPAPTKPLMNQELYRQTTSTELTPNNGHFFVEVDRLTNPNINLPVPNLPAENRSFLSAIRAIGLTSAIQDGRTVRYDIRALLKKSSKAPGALPPAQVNPTPVPEASPPPVP